MLSVSKMFSTYEEIIVQVSRTVKNYLYNFVEFIQERGTFPSVEWSRKKFSERFGSARKAAQMSQAAVARAIGKAPATVSAWLTHAESTFDLDDALNMAQALNVAPCWLVFGHGSPSPHISARAHDLAAVLDAAPGLAALMTAYVNASDADRDMLLQMAKRCPRAEPPAEKKTDQLDAAEAFAIAADTPALYGENK